MDLDSAKSLGLYFRALARIETQLANCSQVKEV